MLLRSASTPILNSRCPNIKDSYASPEPDFLRHAPKSRSISLSASSSGSPSSPCDVSARMMNRTFSETDLREYSSIRKRRSFAEVVEERDVEDEEGDLSRLILTSSGLGVAIVDEEEVSRAFGGEGYISDAAVALAGGGIGGLGGGGGWPDGFGDSGNWDSSHGGSESTDRYYQKMIEANPGNSLLLGNYARFLKDVRGDLAKAEEYCGRAILANPNDGNTLSVYAGLIWETHNDASRAETYFDRAVKAAPEDCYVMASYAKFLWDSEENEEEVESSSGVFHGLHPAPSPIAAV